MNALLTETDSSLDVNNNDSSSCDVKIGIWFEESDEVVHNSRFGRISSFIEILLPVPRGSKEFATVFFFFGLDSFMGFFEEVLGVFVIFLFLAGLCGRLEGFHFCAKQATRERQ